VRYIKFSDNEASAHKAIVVSFDLAGFSVFCNQPDASIAAPRLMKYTFDLLNQFLHDELSKDHLVAPSFIKFSGDGALMIWLLKEGLKDFPQEFCDLVVKTMRDFQQHLSAHLQTWEKDWRVHRLPKRVRVGIATGIVYSMREPYTFLYTPEPVDFVGYCINLAVRLQDYCPELGFLVHGVLHPAIEGMMCLNATKMKGSQTEPVTLFREDIQRVSTTEFNSKFKPA
jgi:class 3 adenylate cyclase